MTLNGVRPKQDMPPTVVELVQLEQREKIAASLGDRIAAFVTAYAGSMAFLWLNLVWFIAWISLHVSGLVNVDPFPFTFLTMIVSLEAIFLSVFVLISENRQAAIADKRAKLDLQVNVLAEREITKLLEIASRIERALGNVEHPDPEVAEMRRPTHITEIADKMESLEQEIDTKSAQGPISAAETEA